ncbi:MAG TPA: alginate export family protein [Gemmatimonadales bacterium]
MHHTHHPRPRALPGALPGAIAGTIAAGMIAAGMLALGLALPAIAAAQPSAQGPVADSTPKPAAAQPALDSVTFQGEVRVRGEADRPGSGVRSDAFTLLRTRVGLTARAGGNARVMVQLQDSRAFGEEESTTDASADAIDLHQAWLELSGRWAASTVALRAGRQEIALGNERLIGAVGWSNTGRSFDGARVDIRRASAPEGWSAMAFAATMRERGRRHGTLPDDVASAPDHLFGGIFATDGNVEGLVVHDRAGRFRTFADVDRTTGYVRFRTPAVGRVHFDLEGAYQLGDQIPVAADGTLGAQQDVRAWFAGGRVVRQGSGLVPTMSLGADWLSGDDDPADATYRAFNTLYATNHKWYGFMDLFLDPAANTRDRGLVDAVLGASLPVSPIATLRADAHGFWTAADGPGPGGERWLGWELDLTMPVRVNAASGLELGYSLFVPGPAGEAVGLGGDGNARHWGYAQLRVAF